MNIGDPIRIIEVEPAPVNDPAPVKDPVPA